MKLKYINYICKIYNKNSYFLKKYIKIQNIYFVGNIIIKRYPSFQRIWRWAFSQMGEISKPIKSQICSQPFRVQLRAHSLLPFARNGGQMRANNDNKGEKKLARSAAEINASSLPHFPLRSSKQISVDRFRGQCTIS